MLKNNVNFGLLHSSRCFITPAVILSRRRVSFYLLHELAHLTYLSSIGKVLYCFLCDDVFPVTHHFHNCVQNCLKPYVQCSQCTLGSEVSVSYFNVSCWYVIYFLKDFCGNILSYFLAILQLLSSVLWLVLVGQ